MIGIYMSNTEIIKRQIDILIRLSEFIKDTYPDLFDECVAENRNPLFYVKSNMNKDITKNETSLNRAILELENLPLKLREQIRGVLTPDLLRDVQAEPNISAILDVSPDLTYVSKLQTGRKIRYIEGIPVEAPASSEESQKEPEESQKEPEQTPKKKRSIKQKKDSSEPSESESEEQEEQPEESETHVFIIHGTLNPDDNRIDTDEELEKRQKYIYDLRYWAWKRLNSLGTFKESVEWEHVEAFFYRHTEDSIWARMFSPPIFWTPVESAGTVLGKIAQAGVFGKYDFGNTELTESNLSIVRRVAQLIEKKQNVLLYGFSVGGLVVQRICELLNIC
jgi:hypothetical protein